MKTIKILTGALFAILAVSCSGEDGNPSYSVENPLESFYEQTNLLDTGNRIDSESCEFGLVFSPNVKGVMKAITVKLPQANPTLKVTIWDYTTREFLRTEIVDVSSSNTLVSHPISELELEKDKKYMITMNSNDWYFSGTLDESDIEYPITAGNIEILEFRWTFAEGQDFPVNVPTFYVRGDLSFDFQQTE